MDATSVQQAWRCDPAADAAVQQQDWENAMLGHQTLLRKDPANCLAIYHLGYIYGKLGSRQEEVAHYEKAVQCGLNRDDHLFYNLGMALAEMSNMEGALTAFEQAVTINPENDENYFGLGLLAQAAGQPRRARSALLKAIDLNPRHWEARIMIARMALDEGQLGAARIQLDALREHVPDHEEVVELWQAYKERRITTYESPSNSP